ncbi:MAG: flagellar hook assembly protein FlgD [Planctomycetota bacterium]|jgi:flagellar basal-body rod modification protein FlgD
MSSVSTIPTASNIQMDYMELLVAQLQNQNPLEPLDNNEMASQLAMFSQLQQLENMNQSFSDTLVATNRTYANSLLGKSVTFYVDDEETGSLLKQVGRVDSVFHDPETQESLLGVVVSEGDSSSDYTLSLDSVVLVEE